MLDTKKTSNFLIQVQNGSYIKQWRQAPTSVTHLAQEWLTYSAMVVQVLQKRQAPWRWGMQWLAIRSSSDQLRGSSKLILLQLQEKLLKNSMWPFLWSFGIWSKLKRWKNLMSGCLVSWPQYKKKIILLSFLILHNNNKPFLDQVGHAAKSGFYTITSNDQLSGWTKKKLQSTPQSQTHQKKVMVTVWWSAASLIHYSFLNPSETFTSEKYAQQIDEMHPKLQRLQLAWVNRKGPVLFQDNARPHIALPMFQKLNKLGYKLLPHPSYSPQLLQTSCNLFNHLNNF